MTGHSGPVARVRFSPDGQLVATSGSDGTVRLGAVSGLPTNAQPFTNQFPTSGTAAFSPDGRVLAAGSGAGLRLWDVSARKPRPPTTGGANDPVLDVAFSPDGRLASGHANGKARIWKVTAGGLVKVAETSKGGYVSTVEFVQGGRMLALSSLDPAHPNASAHILSVWDPSHRRSQVLSRRGPAPPDSPHFVTTPDGDAVAEVDTAVIRFRDLSTGEIEREIRLDARRPGFAAAWSPNGRILATTETNDVKLRNAATTGAQVKVLAGHTERVTAVRFSPNGSTLVSASQDGTIRLWNPHTGELRGEPLPTGHTTSPIADLVFSPDGQTLVSTDGKGGVSFWRLDPQKIAAGICDFIRGQLSAEEWQRHIPELPYQRVCHSV
jgi:WD40 repeat protein